MAVTAQPASVYQRKIWRKLPTQTFTLGGNDIRFELEPNGYLYGLKVKVTGVITLASNKTASFINDRHAIVKQFSMELANGRPDPLSGGLSGVAAHIANLLDNSFDFRATVLLPAAGSGQDANATYTADLETFPVAAASGGAVRANWFIPFMRNWADPRGAIPLGLGGHNYFVVKPGSLADFIVDSDGGVTDFSAASLTIEVWQLAKSSPWDGAAVLPGSTGDGWMVKYEQQFDTFIATTGQPTKIQIPPSDIVLWWAHFCRINGVIATTLDSVAARLVSQGDKDEWLTPEDGIPLLDKLVFDAMEHGRPMPAGLIVYDRDLEADGFGGWIDGDSLNKIESRLTVTSGTTLGSDQGVLTVVKKLRNLNPAGTGKQAG